MSALDGKVWRTESKEGACLKRRLKIKLILKRELKTPSTSEDYKNSQVFLKFFFIFTAF